MALFTPSESPAVVVKEIDLTGGVPNVQTSTGAIVGRFRWGPVGQRTLVSNEADLIDKFATPDTSNTIDFHNAAYFLRYSQSLVVVRETKNAQNSRSLQGNLDSSINAAIEIKNKAAFDARTPLAKERFIARFPGILGNSLQVSICPRGGTADSNFNGWAFKDAFDGPPSTSAYDSAREAVGTEVHVAVVDKNGLFTGTKGTVLETYPYVSVASNSKNLDGTTNYVKDVINEKSEYVYFANFDSSYKNVGLAGTALSAGSTQTYMAGMGVTTYEFDSGSDGIALTKSEFATGADLFEDKEQVEVDFLIAPGMATSTDQVAVVNDLVATAQSLRKDCIVVTSPAIDDVVNVNNESTATTNITSTMNDFTKSSYLVVDGNYLKVYDKFNDQFINIPAASSTAGLMAETDRNAAPWFSPAGARRGQYLGVTSINYNPNKTNRDVLYKAGVNPVVNIAGSGVTLFGDKTALQRPSAFDRINVRRLFLVLERAIERAARNVLFEFNDEFTRAEFVNVIEPVLRDVKGRRGITDFRVVADETVNTPAVIDRNEFIANIFIKPARSINYVTLNFVAVRTGVAFEEVVGTV
jgi:phage tail sheath protein FI